MSRKKYKSRKYKSLNEFRKNHSPSACGHNDYIFGETDTHYKSYGLTTSPDFEYFRYIRLNNNPNPNDKRNSFLRLGVRSTNKKYMDKQKLDWNFSNKDMSIVRNLKKQYKRSINRKPKDWYIKKKIWNKKSK